MRLSRNFVVIICFILVSCSSAAEKDFEKIVTRVNEYFSGKPVLLLDDRIVTGDIENYAYYCIMIKDYNLTSEVKEAFSESTPYNAFLSISCELLDNARSGDLLSNISELNVVKGIIPEQASGFSTTTMALANQNFADTGKSMTIIIKYSYQESKWYYDGILITGLGSSETAVSDLTDFPQNKTFREAVGMVS